MSPSLREQFDTWQPDCERLGISWSPDQLEQLECLYQQLLKVNAHTNLTRIDTPRDFLYRHILDSMNLNRFIPQSAMMADIGSGPGFPALPLAIYRPDIRLVAIESTGKKAHFIQEAAKTLGLKNLSVVCERCETLGQMPTFRDTFDRVSARALAPLNVLLELAIPLLKDPVLKNPVLKDPASTSEKSKLLALKGSKLCQELENAKRALALLHTTHTESHPNPVDELSHSVVAVFEKQRKTPRDYPRQAGTPKKHPLT
ncbi:MAG: 16S rRNA (guanine(527)-N(7))-methyltransferase RsmG [Vampirovibrionales bacterium]|nr:16S rRNA (guanine(527)-N(7))-methyltransferase RsmG [Vampirovibrionales bacterium]